MSTNDKDGRIPLETRINIPNQKYVCFFLNIPPLKMSRLECQDLRIVVKLFYHFLITFIPK